MNTDLFDVLGRAIAWRVGRRAATAGLAGALASVLDRSGDDVRAKKRKKKTLCHNGTTIKVSKKAARAHLGHGDAPGPCPSCRSLGQSCAGGCCGALVCEDVPGCDPPSGPYCCGDAGGACGNDCDCCGAFRCNERQGGVCGTCAPTQAACAVAGDCCHTGGCGDNGCDIDDACLQAPGGACVDDCDCAADLLCHEREGKCQSCLLPKEACTASTECCFVDGACGDNGCADEPNQVCCQGLGGACLDSCDCCAGLVCADDLEECIPIDEAQRAKGAAPDAPPKTDHGAPGSKAQWAARRRNTRGPHK